MAFFDSLRNLLGRGTQYENVTYVGPTVSEVLGLGPEDLFRTQPHLRTVITFVARNIAQLPLHAYERVSDTDRRRVTDDPMARVLKAPNPDMTWFELDVLDHLGPELYDQAVWMTLEDPDSPTGWLVRPVPPSWIDQTGGGTAWAPAWISVVRPSSGKRTLLQEGQFLAFHGYRPGQPDRGVSPVESLKEILAEQIQAWSYRQQVWQRGGRVGAYITRPADKAWSPEAREKFSKDWSAKWTGKDGPRAGGTPILEDGMTLNRLGFSAREDEWSEVAKLSLATVAAVYHTSPTMVGILDNANYSNVREFHQMLYTDTLGPDLAMIADRINTFLVPRISKVESLYVEFNVSAKLAGSFEEQAAVLSTSTGRPYMTANEARAKLNLPALVGDAEHLVTPLNVLVGGQASPQDGVTAGGGGTAAAVTSPVDDANAIKVRVDAAAALIRSGFDPVGALEAVGLDPIKHLGLLPVTVQRPQEPDNVDEETVDALKSHPSAMVLTKADGETVRIKAQPAEAHAKAAQQVLVRFFKRQRVPVLSALGAKSDGAEWWDEDRWNDELAADLLALSMAVTTDVGADTLKGLGIDPDVYSDGQTVEFLKAVAASRAGAINSTTRDQIKAALAGDVGEGAEMATPAGVFDVAEGPRAEAAGVTLATTLSAFAVTEATKQSGKSGATKTWLTTSSNPRSSHAAMSGETVPIDDTFSNGMAWPGDATAGDAAEVANCLCSVEVTVP